MKKNQFLAKRIVRFISGCAILCTISMPVLAESAQPLLLTHSDLAAIKSDPAKVAFFVNRCDAELGHAASPVESYSPAQHYSAQGAVHNDMTHDIGQDGEIAYRSALCYSLTGDIKYARHTQAIVDAWATTVQDVDKGQGRGDFNFFFPQYIIAASLVRSAGGWDDSRFTSFLQDVVAPLSNSYRPNNHGDWGVLLDASIAAYTGDQAKLNTAINRWQNLMQSQVADDGSMPQEICRTDTTNWCDGPRKGINGLSYTHWALLPVTLAAKLFESQGESVWQTPGGQKLAAAYDRAASWSLHPESFPYYESNNGKLNGVTNAGYFAVLQQHYPNPDAKTLLSAGNLKGDRFDLALIF